MITGLLVTAGIAGLVGMLVVSKASVSSEASSAGSNVAMVDGLQIVTIMAKGGYLPEVSTAKVGVPTVLRFVTKGTFDCSSIVSIPSLGISKDLPMTGTTDIPVGELAAGTLQGTCGMGMYRFKVVAE